MKPGERSPKPPKIDAIRQFTGVHVALTHHSGKSEERGERGHSSLPGAVDARIRVEQVHGQHIATPLKVRDGDLPEPVQFRRVVVPLGTDEDGDTVTSCAIQPVSDFDPVPKAEVAPDSQAGALLSTLRELIETTGKPNTEGVIVVSEKALRDAFKMRHMKDVTAATARQAFGRAVTALVSRGHAFETRGNIGLSP